MGRKSHGEMLKSQFRKGDYRGYEIRLRLERNLYEPYSIKCPEDVYAFMKPLGEESAEFVYQINLDAKNQVTGVYLVAKGGCDSCPLDPREVYKVALVTNSRAFALVHNHPSGDVQPSPEDKTVAIRISQGAKLLDLDFLEFMIIGDNEYFSMAEQGMLPKG